METNLCVAGFGGQGVMSIGKLLATAACDSTDHNVTFFHHTEQSKEDELQIVL